jgi:hypothetical protein
LSLLIKSLDPSLASSLGVSIQGDEKHFESSAKFGGVVFYLAHSFLSIKLNNVAKAKISKSFYAYTAF